MTMDQGQPYRQTDRPALANAGGARAAATVASCYAAGLEAFDRGDLEETRSWATRCDAAAGGDGDARCTILHAMTTFGSGDVESAWSHFRQAAELPPHDPAVLLDFAEALEASGALREAAQVLEEVARRTPDDASVLVDLGYLRMMNGDGSGARESVERAVSLRPEDTAIRHSLAQIYEALGEPALAAETLAAVARDAPSIHALLDLARLNLQLERYAEAEKAFRALRRLDPEHELIALQGRTWCRIKQGDSRGALDVVLSATRLDRYDLTTAFLIYARDRLFGSVPDAAQREAALEARFRGELHEYIELHNRDPVVGQGDAEKEGNRD